MHTIVKSVILITLCLNTYQGYAQLDGAEPDDSKVGTRSATPDSPAERTGGLWGRSRNRNAATSVGVSNSGDDSARETDTSVLNPSAVQDKNLSAVKESSESVTSNVPSTRPSILFGGANSASPQETTTTRRPSRWGLRRPSLPFFVDKGSKTSSTVITATSPNDIRNPTKELVIGSIFPRNAWRSNRLKMKQSISKVLQDMKLSAFNFTREYTVTHVTQFIKPSDKKPMEVLDALCKILEKKV